MKRRKPPGRLWLFFFGRRRRGFPGLLVGVLLLAVLLGLSFASRSGAAISYWVGLVFVAVIALLAVGAVAIALAASLRPPRGR